MRLMRSFFISCLAAVAMALLISGISAIFEKFAVNSPIYLLVETLAILSLIILSLSTCTWIATYLVFPHIKSRPRLTECLYRLIGVGVLTGVVTFINLAVLQMLVASSTRTGFTVMFVLLALVGTFVIALLFALTGLAYPNIALGKARGFISALKLSAYTIRHSFWKTMIASVLVAMVMEFLAKALALIPAKLGLMGLYESPILMYGILWVVALKLLWNKEVQR